MSATGRRHVSPTQCRAEREQRQRRVLRATTTPPYGGYRVPVVAQPRCGRCADEIDSLDGDAKQDGIGRWFCGPCNCEMDAEEARHQPDDIGWHYIEGE